MAEDYIQLPPDGVGKKVRAIRRPDNRYEEVMVPFSKDGEVDLATLLNTLKSRLPRKIELDDGTGVYAEIYRTNRALRTFVKNFPTEYPLPSAQVTSLKAVTVENFPTEYPLPSGQVASLKAVTVENFPANYPLPNAQIADLRKVTVQNLLTVRGYTDFDITTTAEATTEVIPAPATGYKIRLFDIHFASTADIITALRFGATGDLMWALPTKGAISKNLINRERDAPEATGLYVYISGAGRVLGTIGYEVVSV